MNTTNDVALVKRFSIASLIAVAILEDGTAKLAEYMAAAGYPEQHGELEAVLGVSINEDEPRICVNFSYLSDTGDGFESGTFFLTVQEDNSVAGDY